jgi:hypothetical protein
MDDYTAWVVDSPANQNIGRIRLNILPQLEKWEQESGAVFESSKTAFTHFITNGTSSRDGDISLQSKPDTGPSVCDWSHRAGLEDRSQCRILF